MRSLKNSDILPFELEIERTFRQRLEQKQENIMVEQEKAIQSVCRS